MASGKEKRAGKEYEPLDWDVEFDGREDDEQANGDEREASQPTPIPPVNEDGIADEMKAVDRWLLWHGVWNAKKGKYDKQPWSPDGYKWSAHDPSHWTSYEDAIDAHLADPATVSGIGFEPGFDEGSNLTYWFFDDDNRVHGIKAEPELQAILDGFPYGSRELSPSGKGVRIFFATEGEADYYHENPDGSASELYNGRQFGTATGNDYQNNGYPFVAPMEAVEKLIELAGLPKMRDSAPHGANRNGGADGKAGSEREGGEAFDPLGNDGESKQQSELNIRLAESYLAVIPAEAYGTWYKVGMALHEGGYSYEVWEKWSRTSKKFDADDARKTWESFGSYDDKRITFAFIVELAYRHGWLPKNPPVASPFFMGQDGRTLYRAAKSKNSYPTRVTSTPPYIVAKITDIDPGAPDRVRVRMDLPTTYGETKQVEFVLNRSELFDKKVLYKTLTDLGGNLSESNASLVVEYLTVCDGAKWAANLPHERSTAHMGWAGEPLGVFMPYDEGKADIGFDPPLDRARISTAFQEPKGTLGGWLEIVAPLRAESVVLRAMLAAGFASVLLDVLGVQPFVVYVWGLSGSGKTASLKIAGSPWGDTAEGAGYFAKLSDTDTSIFQRAGQLHSMPLILDEFESIRKPTEQAKRSYFQHLAYDLSYGVERNRSNRSLRYVQGASWKLVTLSAGETPATGDTTQQGALNRIIEINGEPFRDRRRAQNAHRAISNQYGQAGRAFIEYVKGKDADEMRARYDALRADVLDVIPDHPQPEILAALAFGDLMAERAVFAPSVSYDEAHVAAVKFAKLLSRHTKGASERDTDRRAIEFVAEWLATNEVYHFRESRTQGVVIEPYGRHSDTEGVWYVMADKLTRALEDNGFNRDKTIRRMGVEGILRKPSRGHGWLGRKSVGTSKPYPYCYAIDEEALDGYIADGDGE